VTAALACDNGLSETARGSNPERPLTHLSDYTGRGLAVKATRTCTHPDGCLRPARSGGWCQGHYDRRRRSGDLGPVVFEPRRPRGQQCKHPDGCPRPARCRGFCPGHYRRWRKTGDVGPAELARWSWEGRSCKELECYKLARSRGWCPAHYQLWRKHGDPTVRLPSGPRRGLRGSENPRYVGDAAGYHGVHDRLRAQRGAASDHSCAHCDNQAAEWAYSHSDPDERIDARIRRPYSLDLSHYIPLCVPCHRRFDLARRTTGGR
jgi:hypothetical protein